MILRFEDYEVEKGNEDNIVFFDLANIAMLQPIDSKSLLHLPVDFINIFVKTFENKEFGITLSLAALCLKCVKNHGCLVKSDRRKYS